MRQSIERDNPLKQPVGDKRNDRYIIRQSLTDHFAAVSSFFSFFSLSISHHVRERSASERGDRAGGAPRNRAGGIGKAKIRYLRQA